MRQSDGGEGGSDDGGSGCSGGGVVCCEMRGSEGRSRGCARAFGGFMALMKSIDGSVSTCV